MTNLDGNKIEDLLEEIAQTIPTQYDPTIHITVRRVMEDCSATRRMAETRIQKLEKEGILERVPGLVMGYPGLKGGCAAWIRKELGMG